ncbi:MAG: CHAD domain-containing protein [Pseudomonadota bacterium]|nr:CHAD domain-containing protein [Pseudomonadota bacterium]
MAFVLKPTEKVGKEISRLGCEQLGDAISRLTGPDRLDRSIHEARKCLKRSRALLALSQPAMSGKRFEREDRRIRKIARNLARVRDAHAMMETVDKLGTTGGLLSAAERLRKELGARVASVNRGMDEGAMARVVERLKKAQSRFARLKLKNKWVMIEEGVTNTYRQARKSYRLAMETGQAQAYHEWRKPMQRHWRQMQLFAGLGNPALDVRIDKAQRLSQLLGDDHDLHMLVEAVKAGKVKFGSDMERDELLTTCECRLESLRQAAREEGETLFAPKPREFRAMFANQIGRAAAQPVADEVPNLARADTASETTAGITMPSKPDGSETGLLGS